MKIKRLPAALIVILLIAEFGWTTNKNGQPDDIGATDQSSYNQKRLNEALDNFEKAKNEPHAKQSDPLIDSALLACETDKNCTTVLIPCKGWQPVNQKHVSDIPVYPACTSRSSLSPLPQPNTRCIKHLCVIKPG